MRASLFGGVVVALFAFQAHAAKFSVFSNDVKNNQTLASAQVFSGMGCTGENVSPHLSWKDAPEGTKSFVVTVYDPDAPTGSGWWHWVLYNIPADRMELPSGTGSKGGSLPTGAVAAKNDFGVKDFGGACPPPGDKPHRYEVTVYALKVDKLDIPADASPAFVGFATKANTLASAKLTGKYSRKQ